MNKYCSLIDLSLITKFDKGIEIGSKNYFDKKEDGFISYIRVGDLLNQSNTYINQNIKSKTATYEDILIAFDGAPGRISYALRGAYSSGIYKIVPNDEFYKGLIYFELSSTLNQKIIKDNSQGTTILHASKSIPYLKYAQCSDEDIIVFNNFYKILINLKIKIDKLNNIKNILLNKYFTNQQ